MEEYILAFDEINALVAYSYEISKSIEEVIDDVLSILIAAYKLGIHDVGKMLKYDISVNVDTMQKAIYLEIDGKTFEDRARDHLLSGDLYALEILVESEYHRVYNTALFNGAILFRDDTGEDVTKEWRTLRDNKVRETHEYLEGEEVDIDEEFYTFDGDHALHPGGFKKASNNVNCRCYLVISES